MSTFVNQFPVPRFWPLIGSSTHLLRAENNFLKIKCYPNVKSNSSYETCKTLFCNKVCVSIGPVSWHYTFLIHGIKSIFGEILVQCEQLRFVVVICGIWVLPSLSVVLLHPRYNLPFPARHDCSVLEYLNSQNDYSVLKYSTATDDYY